MSKTPETPKQAKATPSLKQKLVDTLETVPIFTAACDKLGIPRSTYYKWRQLDEKFARAADNAIVRGRIAVNGMAKTMLLKKMREGNMTAIIFWLKHNDPDFNPKITIEMKSDERYTKEELKLLATALKHMGFAGVVLNEKELRKNFLEQADPEARARHEELQRTMMTHDPQEPASGALEPIRPKARTVDELLRKLKEDGAIR